MNTPLDTVPNYDLRVETFKQGPFTFRLGLDLDTLDLRLLLTEIRVAHDLFCKLTLGPEVLNQLQNDVTVSSVYGTNCIEGGLLTEEQTRRTIQLDEAEIQELEQRRAFNLKKAYDYSRAESLTTRWHLDLNFIRKLHEIVTNEIPHMRDRPGLFRSNPNENVTTWVGGERYGGEYRPPEPPDIPNLMQSLIKWHDSLVEAKISPLIRAPLVHFYYEIIHPFYDGNGRVGRLIEASLLEAGGYKFTSGISQYYYEHVDTYFLLINQCRKDGEKKKENPNTDFVMFHLAGINEIMHKMHGRNNKIAEELLYKSRVSELMSSSKINSRQKTIIDQLLKSGPKTKENISHESWYTSTYLGKVDKTRQRDWAKLVELQLIRIDNKNRVCIYY